MYCIHCIHIRRGKLLTGGGGQIAYQHALVSLKILVGVVNVLDFNGDYQGRRQNLGSKGGI